MLGENQNMKMGKEMQCFGGFLYSVFSIMTTLSMQIAFKHCKYDYLETHDRAATQIISNIYIAAEEQKNNNNEKQYLLTPLSFNSCY